VNLLLDSHALLWALAAPDKLSPAAKEAIRRPSNVVYYSPVSVWELEIKAARGKLDLPPDWTGALDRTGILEQPVTTADAVRAARLPPHHADPFDRMLVAQALNGELQLVTRDAFAAAYGVPVLPA